MDEGHGDEDMKQGEDQETNILDDDLALLVVATARDSTWVRTIEALNRRSLLLINSGKIHISQNIPSSLSHTSQLLICYHTFPSPYP